MNLDFLVSEIEKVSSKNNLTLIGIDGRSGSGKSTLSKQIAGKLKGVSVVHLDEFDLYQGKESVQRVIKEVIEPLKNNKKKSIVILEGVFALVSDLKPFYDYKIWLECPASVGFDRGLKRDIAVTGFDNSEKWINYWLPKEEEYIQKEDPKSSADQIWLC